MHRARPLRWLRLTLVEMTTRRMLVLSLAVSIPLLMPSWNFIHLLKLKPLLLALLLHLLPCFTASVFQWRAYDSVHKM